ncbi:hypothetical protein E4H12_13940 [Candidatus Thorarchaeota archaeon]|jgi:hypothetical protein|nr:MAG: hypothetical protein E4H12_13940 [Candidatus Thorarchaeota archaeon]
MPKKKGKSSRKAIIGIILVVVVAVAIIGWHDGLVGVTPIESINNFSVDNGTAVTIKGEITIIFGDLVTVADATGGLGFLWSDSGSLSVGQIVVVRGVVSSPITLTDVTSVAPVWLIA